MPAYPATDDYPFEVAFTAECYHCEKETYDEAAAVNYKGHKDTLATTCQHCGEALTYDPSDIFGP